MFNIFARTPNDEKRALKPASSSLIVLNILRACNIIALLNVVVASWIMLVMTVKTSNFFFFDGVSHFITSTISIFLIVSELSLFKKFFTCNFPLLGPQSTLLFLGSSMIAVGFNILGNLNKQATSVQALGLPMWRVVISSGVLSSVFGFLAIVANFWYRDTRLKQTARQTRSRYIQQELPVDAYIRPMSLAGTTYNSAQPMNRASKLMSRFIPFGHKRESTRFPVITGPYLPKDQEWDTEKLSRRSSVTSYGGQTCQPEVVEDRMNPIAKGIEKPDSIYHPSNYPSANRYSESNYSRTTHGGPIYGNRI